MAKKIKSKKIKKSRSTNRRNYINSLHLKNFKSFAGSIENRPINIKFAPKITLLFGKNSAGKSSILQAIKLIQQSYENGGDLILNPNKSYPGGLYFPSYKDLVFKRDISKSIHLGLTADEKFHKNDSKSIIKKFDNIKNKITCSEVDFYSPSDTENLLDKFVSIKNQQSHLESLDEEYLRSEISFIDNKYSWNELFKYTFKNKKTIIPFLDKCIDFTKKFNSILSKRKRNKNLDNEVDKLIQGGSSLIGEFSPLQFKFANEKTIQQYKKFLLSMKNNIDPFIKFLSNDIKKNKKFLYRNNKTFSRQSIIKMLISKTMKTAEEDKKNEKILSEHAVSYVTFADFLCEVNSRLCGVKFPSRHSFDPNNNDEPEKILDPKMMIKICDDRISSTVKSIKIFQGQKALPFEYENVAVYEENFVGYNYEFLHKVIEKNKKDVNKWLKHFGYDFKIATESGGPTSVTLIQHQKDKFKVNYKYGGLGAENVLPVIAQSVAAKNKILIFEEPERRAHPSLQVKLADLIVECSKNNQFIIETHSENLLLGILKNIRDGKISNKDVQVSYVHIDKGESHIDELKINENGNFESNWRHGFFTERLDLI